MRDLCGILRKSSSYVGEWLKRQPGVKEESLTDWLLFDISQHTNRIRYKAFTRHQEGRETGADWEWWLLLNEGNLRLRIQAKMAHSAKDLYPALHHSNAHGLQIDKLLSDAKRCNALAFYAFYSGFPSRVMCGGQPRNGEGVFLASARRVYNSYVKPAKGRVLPADVLAMANPISCLFCCAIGTRRGVPLDFLNNYYPEEFDSRAHHGDMLQASVAPHEPLRRGFHPSLPPYVEASLNPELISDVEENSNFKIPRELGHLHSIDLRDGE